MDGHHFAKNVADIRDSARRITGGLESLVSSIDTIAHDNAPFLTNDAPLPESDHGTAIRNLLQGIRRQIGDIVEQGRQFENKMASCSTHITELSRQLRENKQAAMLDPITGIGNRRKFEESLADILKRLEDFNGKISVLLADVDHFKALNDTFGHSVGDQVLRLVAKTFVNCLKGGDEVARWGGDEFAAILPNTTLDNAVAVSAYLQDTMNARSLKNRITGENMGKITLSIGVSTYRDGDNAHELIFRADQALCEAKRRGHNRTVAKED